MLSLRDTGGAERLETMRLHEDLAPPIISNGHESPGSCGSCAWSSDGHYFAWSCGHRIVKVIRHWKRQTHHWNDEDAESLTDACSRSRPLMIDAGELVWSVTFGSRTTCSESNHLKNGRYRFHVIDDVILAIGLRNGRIRTWDMKTGCLKLELIDHTTVVSDLRFAPDGSLRLISCSYDGTLKVWDFDDDGNMTKTVRTIYNKVFGCCWSPDARLLAAVGDHKSVQLWDMQTYKLVHRFDGHLHYVSKCDFSADGTLLATASYDTRIIVWDVHSGVPLLQLFHKSPPPSLIFAGGANGAYVRGVSFSPDGQYIASVCDDGYLRVWDISDHQLPLNEVAVESARLCRFSPDGVFVAVGTSKGHALIWQPSLQVTSLQHLCRSVIRRYLVSSDISKLDILPHRLVQYLQYSL